MFEVTYSRKADKFIAKSPEKLRRILKELFLVLRANPFPAQEYDLRKITGMEDTYRVRLSSYRVVYCVDTESKKIKILKVERRDDGTYDF